METSPHLSAQISIGFDAKRVFHNFTGLGNFSRTLIRDLHRFYPQLGLHLFTPSAPPHPRTQEFLAKPGYHIHEKSFSPSSLWRSFGMANSASKQGIQIFHGLSQELPVGLEKRRIKQLVSIHDLIFHHYPNQYAWTDRLIYKRKMKFACASADRIIAISHATKNDLINVYGIEASRIAVIHQSCADQFWEESPRSKNLATLTKYRIQSPYVLSVGSIIKRKSLKVVIEGMALLPESTRPLLVVVGKGKSYEQEVKEKIRETKLDKWVKFLPDVLFKELPALYGEALFSIYPSEYEGFGIPILESLACKTSVLASKKSSLPEVGGSGAHYVEKVHPVEIAEGMEKMLMDESYRNQLVQDGWNHIQQFRARTITDQWVNLYSSITN